MRACFFITISLWLASTTLSSAQPVLSKVKPAPTSGDIHQPLQAVSDLNNASSASTLDNFVQKYKSNGYVFNNLRRELYSNGKIKTYVFSMVAPKIVNSKGDISDYTLNFSVENGPSNHTTMDISFKDETSAKAK